MGKFFVPLLLISAFVRLGDSYIQVISTTCQREDAFGNEVWMTCPEEASRAPMSIDEIRENRLSSDEDQKFCCGDKQHRYCCSIEGKLQEIPEFDPSQINDDPWTVYHYEKWYHFGWFTYLIIFVMTIVILGLILYISGCLVANILECIFCFICECFGKKKKNSPVPKTGKPYRAGELGRGERSTLVVVSPPAPRSTSYPPTTSSAPPPNYQTIASNSNGFGGTPDLYQNVTSSTSSVTELPSYEDVQRQTTRSQQFSSLYPHV